MKIRTIALAGAATLALSAPALADHVGWYLGLGVGYEQTQSTTLVLPPDPAIPTPSLGLKERFSGSGIYLVDAGYKFNNGIRVEGELAYKDPNAKVPICIVGVGCAPAGTPPFGKGGKDVGSLMVNFVYDWQLGEDWGLSLGGGFGAADVNEHIKTPLLIAPPDNCLVCGAHIVPAYQAIIGAYFELGEDWDLSAEYRY